MKLFLQKILIISFLITGIWKCEATIPVPSHVVVLVLENHGYNQIFGSPYAPYLNSFVGDDYAAWFTQSYALSHPSQPNYLQLFSGSNQGVTDDSDPLLFPFVAPNLGSSLINNGRTFVGYSEDLPSVGFNGTSSGNYFRKHNPWVNWQGANSNSIPASSNQPFSAFPADYNLLPTVSFVIPNQVNDMHDGSDPQTITTCDTWIQQNLSGYINWAKSHNSLLIITFDEDDFTPANQIFTMFIGHMVNPGPFSVAINHYNILRMLEDMYSLPHSGNAATAATIDYCWFPCYLSIPIITPQGPLTLCPGNSITLTTGNAINYVWSTGATTQSINVTTPGSYTVFVTALSGCGVTSLPVGITTPNVPVNTVLFTESMGTVSTNTAITTHESNNGFDNDNFTMSGSGEIRNTNVSSGYDASAPPASGLGNAFLTNTVGKNFFISGINTYGLSNLQMSFGVYKSTTTGTGADGSDLSLTLSTDGINYNTTMTIPALPTGTNTNKWYYVTPTGTIPAVPNLRIQFKENGTVTQYRIDDIRMQYTNSTEISASSPLNFCPGDSVVLTAVSGNNYLWSTGATTRSIIAKNAGSYTVTVDCVPSNPKTVSFSSCNILVNLKVFIEGFYTGNNSMTALISPTGCDLITLELHDTVGTYAVKGFDIDTLNTSGNVTFRFPDSLAGKSYYLVVRHRNSVELWSKRPYTLSATAVTLDLTVPDQGSSFPVPVLNSISPTSIAAGSSTFTMTLTGSNFVTGSTVKWNGTSLTTTYIGSTQLSATIPSGNILSVGTASITVFNPTPGGGTSGIQTFTITNPVVTLTSISPSTVTAGSSTFTMTLTGANFLSGSVAQWNGASLTTAFINSTQLTASIPAANILNAGTANITVFNSSPASSSSPLIFTINNPAPTLTSIAPSSATAGSSTFTMTLTGTNFVSSSVAQWNGVSLATTYVSSTQLTASVPSTNVTTAGTANVTVVNASPGGGTTVIKTFTINNPVPTLTSIAPSSATAGGSTFTMTLTGTNFVSSSVAQWNGSSLTTTFISSTQLTASVPSSNVATTGTVNVTVINATPGGGTTGTQVFTINNPAPTLTTISPASTTAGAATFTMTLTGINFISSSVAKWNGASLTTTYVSSTQLTATVPSTNVSSSGTANVTVFNPTPGGGTSGSKTFTINPVILVKKFLFDATKAETAGNADWVIDEDNSTPQRVPTPTQSNIVSSTTETYWTGALSSWGIALVKSGNFVETLPSGTAITYGNGSNPQDLSNYDVFVVDEPNILFTATEKTAILNFVNAGGGLFMVADHTGSDRNMDGYDSPAIWNDLMTNNGAVNNPFGLSFNLTSITELSGNIRSNSSSNVILNGSQGSVTQMDFNAGTTIAINTTANPNATGLIWKGGATQNTTNIMCASSTYGTGRVFVVGDSSPIDDGTGASGNTLYVGWPLYSHTALFMNASLWLAKLQ